jgi:hypothetical protein
VTSGATSLLARVVRAHGIALATPVDVLLDPGVRRVLGFELVGRDGVRRFLPWVACDVDSDEIRVDSLLALLTPASFATTSVTGSPLAGFEGGAWKRTAATSGGSRISLSTTQAVSFASSSRRTACRSRSPRRLSTPSGRSCRRRTNGVARAPQSEVESAL